MVTTTAADERQPLPSDWREDLIPCSIFAISDSIIPSKFAAIVVKNQAAGGDFGNGVFFQFWANNNKAKRFKGFEYENGWGSGQWG